MQDVGEGEFQHDYSSESLKFIRCSVLKIWTLVQNPNDNWPPTLRGILCLRHQLDRIFRGEVNRCIPIPIIFATIFTIPIKRMSMKNVFSQSYAVMCHMPIVAHEYLMSFHER